MKKRKKKNRFLGQSTVEYLILLCIVIIVVISCGFVDNIRGAFENYRDRANTAMAGS